MSETSDIVKPILQYLELAHIFAWRNNTGRRGNVRYGFLGSGDITGILPGGARLEIEVKAPGGKQSEAQRAFAKRITDEGGCYVLAMSITDVIRGIMEYQRKMK